MNLSKDIVNFTKETDSKIESGNTLGVLFGKIKHFIDGEAEHNLPDTTGAVAGQAVVLDADKKPVWGSILPVGGTAGQFLRVDSDGKPAWETVPAAEDSSF